MLRILHFAAWVGTSIAVAELLGYLLHRLLHTGWIPWLSMSHMKHHMVLYGPLQKQRPSEEYLDATAGSVALGNIGLEWIIPSSMILTTIVVVLRLLRVSSFDQTVSIGTTLAWTFLMFSYLHDQMHVKNFWMERNSVLQGWFRGARKWHDIHHRVLNDRGLMDKNFGIGLFLFDRLFGTFSPEQSPFNHRGYAAARERFKYVEEPRARRVCWPRASWLIAEMEMKNTKTDIQQETMKENSLPPRRGKAMRRFKPGTISNTVVGLAAVLAILSLVPYASAQKYVFNNGAFASGLRPVWVVTGDFNRDGVKDIAVINECGSDATCLAGGSVSILPGNPDGTFQKLSPALR